MKYAVIFLFTFALLFPLYWMFQGSVQDIQGLIKIPPNWIPKKVTLMNYRDIVYVSTAGTIEDGYGTKYDKKPDAIPRWTFNTFVIFGIKTFIAVVLVATAGYAFSVYEFKRKGTIFMVYIIGILIPPNVMFIPTFVTSKYLGITESWWGIILPFAYTPVGVYIFKNYIDTIPREMIDSARIDGASELKILYKIMLPLCKPVIGTMVMLVALGTLQDYIWSLLMTPKTANQTLMVGVIQEVLRKQALSGGLNPIGSALAGGVIIFMPLFLIFLFCQRYFIEGLTLGGIK